MKKKDILRYIKDYQAFIKTQTGKNLKTIQSDGRGEYIDHEVIDYLKSDMKSQLSTHLSKMALLNTSIVP